jgi:hypothetical protein
LEPVEKTGESPEVCFHRFTWQDSLHISSIEGDGNEQQKKKKYRHFE